MIRSCLLFAASWLAACQPPCGEARPPITGGPEETREMVETIAWSFLDTLKPELRCVAGLEVRDEVRAQGSDVWGRYNKVNGQVAVFNDLGDSTLARVTRHEICHGAEHVVKLEAEVLFDDLGDRLTRLETIVEHCEESLPAVALNATAAGVCGDSIEAARLERIHTRFAREPTTHERLAIEELSQGALDAGEADFNVYASIFTADGTRVSVPISTEDSGHTYANVDLDTGSFVDGIVSFEGRLPNHDTRWFPSSWNLGGHAEPFDGERDIAVLDQRDRWVIAIGSPTTELAVLDLCVTFEGRPTLLLVGTDWVLFDRTPRRLTWRRVRIR